MAANTALRWITAKAKQIRRANPKKQWKDCIKEAGRLYKGGARKPTHKKRRVSGYKVVERRETKQSKPKKIFVQKRSSAGRFKGVRRIGFTTRRTTKWDQMRGLEHRYAENSVKRLRCDTIRGKRKYTKILNKIQSELIRLANS